jgi:hypothetical protein
MLPLDANPNRLLLICHLRVFLMSQSAARQVFQAQRRHNAFHIRRQRVSTRIGGRTKIRRHSAPVNNVCGRAERHALERVIHWQFRQRLCGFDIRKESCGQRLADVASNDMKGLRRSIEKIVISIVYGAVGTNNHHIPIHVGRTSIRDQEIRCHLHDTLLV